MTNVETRMTHQAGTRRPQAAGRSRSIASSRWRPPVGSIVVLFSAVAVFLSPPAARAQLRQDPHISFVYPAGGRQGTSFEVTVGGERLKEVTEAHLSGGGVRIVKRRFLQHLTSDAGFYQRLMQTQDRLDAEAKKAGKPTKKYSNEELMKLTKYTDYEMMQWADYKKRAIEKKRQINPQLMEEITLRITLAEDARLGERELRLLSPTGMSNPLFFFVSNMPEFRETEPNDKVPDPVIGDTLPAVINGQIMPGDIDRFSFKARKGTHFVAAANVRAVIPYLADAVPGWFQAVLVLYDARNRELAYADAFGFRQDPMIYYEIPEDGEYTIEIRDSLYRGREDFVYRIALGELPFINGIFPLGGRQGTQVTVQLNGWNLPVDHVTFTASYDRKRPLRSIAVRKGELVSNRVPFPVDMLPECMEEEPNDGPENAQEVKLPIIVNGRIDRPGDIDVFRFEGQAHEHVVAEVYARRLGSPLDSLLRLVDANGHEVASNDDFEDKSAALITHHADSRIVAVLPASGTYYLRLIDAQHKGGPEYAYRLYIRPPRPDFELRVVPSSIFAKAGTSVPITVYALRKDDFAGDIQLQLEDAPPGFTLDGPVVPAGQDKVRLTLSVPPKPTDEPISLDLEGRSALRARKLSHFAVPAEDWMQAFAYHHLVPARDWTVAVTGRGVNRPPVQFPKDERARLPVGGTARVRMLSVNKTRVDDIRFELSDPPDGILIKDHTFESESVVVLLSADVKKAKPGLKGNLIFEAFREYIPKNADGKPLPPQRYAIGTLPALPFEILAHSGSGRGESRKTGKHERAK
jgi:hypothetical protein